MSDLTITLDIGWLLSGLLTATWWLFLRVMDLLLTFGIIMVLIKGYYKIIPKDKSKDNPSD